MGNEKAQRKEPPQIVKLDKALKLAEEWVKGMSEVVEDEPTKEASEGRPHRLGLGAKPSRLIKRGPSDDTIERKMQAKLGIKPRKALKTASDTTPTIKSGSRNDKDSNVGSSDDEEESKARAFGKKKSALGCPMK